jgi:hypothetical protein
VIMRSREIVGNSRSDSVGSCTVERVLGARASRRRAWCRARHRSMPVAALRPLKRPRPRNGRWRTMRSSPDALKGIYRFLHTDLAAGYCGHGRRRTGIDRKVE